MQMEISSGPRVGGVGVDLLKNTNGPQSNKRYTLENMWTTNTDTGRAVLPLLALCLASGGVAFIFGYRAQSLGDTMLAVVDTYRVLSPNFYVENFTSLVAFNTVTDTQEVGKCLLWGSVINGLALFLNTYFVITGIGRRSQKMLHLFITFGFCNACTYGALGMIALVVGEGLYGEYSNFTAACNRLLNPQANAFCNRDTNDAFGHLQQSVLGGGIPLIVCSAILLVCFGLVCSSVSIMRAHPTLQVTAPPAVLVADVPPAFGGLSPPLRTDLANPHREWMEVRGLSHAEAGVGTASLVVPLPGPDPVNVGPALTSLSKMPPRAGGGQDVLFQSMQQEMERLGQDQYAQQYREAQRQMQGFQ